MEGDKWSATKSSTAFVPPQKLIPPVSLTSIQFAQQLQQHNSDQSQCQQGQVQIPASTPIERPWLIRFIGCMDILSGILFTALAVLNLKLSDPGSQLHFFFVVLLPIFVRLMMGFALLTGLKNGDDSTALFYSKIWIVCQLAFLFYSVFEIVCIIALYAYASDRSPTAMELLRHTTYTDLPVSVTILLKFGLFIYRVLCFVLVQLFVEKLKRSVAQSLVAVNAYFQQQQKSGEEAESENLNEFAVKENAMCEPAFAMLLTM